MAYLRDPSSSYTNFIALFFVFLICTWFFKGSGHEDSSLVGIRGASSL